MEWSHTHLDGYELLAVPSESPSSIIILDSSALVLVQKVILPDGDSSPRALTWQPGGARTGCSSGALSCVVSSRGGGPDLLVFTPNGVHLSSRVRYSWSCAARVPLSPLHKDVGGRLLLAWSCRGPLVVADQAISVWSNSRAVPSANAISFSSDDSSSNDGESDSSASETENIEGSSTSGLRGAYRNSLRLSRKWVRKAVSAGRTAPAPHFVALATSPCGCMFATACQDSDEVIIWLRRRNMPAQGKPWEEDILSGQQKKRGHHHRGEGGWDFQPATVLAHDGPLVQVVWGRGLGAQQDYLLTLGEDGSARVWVEQHWQQPVSSFATERGTIQFACTASISSWYGDPLRLKSVGFVKWAYFGSHRRDLVHREGTASSAPYELAHQQEQGLTKPYRSDNWVVGCGEDGRRFLWSLKDMPLPDGRTIPEPVEVASLPFSWLVGLSTGASATPITAVVQQVSAVGYYDAQSADGAPTELQVVARAAGGTIAVMTARVHRADVKSRYVLRNTRSVVLPLGQPARGLIMDASVNGSSKRAGADVSSKAAGFGHAEGIAHPNLPLVIRLGRSKSGGESSVSDTWAVEVHSWVNGGSHLQCIPCKPRGSERGQPGHTAGAEPGNSVDSNNTFIVGQDSFNSSDGSGLDGKAKVKKDRVAPVFSELAQKVRSGDELSFVPYALPSLTLQCHSLPGKTRKVKPTVDESDNVVCYCGAGASCNGQGQGQGDIKHAMWLADWIGTEALPPTLAVIDVHSRLHVFELDDGTSSEELPAAGDSSAGVIVPDGSPRREERKSLRKRTSALSPTVPLTSLSHSRHTFITGLMEEETKELDRSSSPGRMSRRARREFGGPDPDVDEAPIEKTVVLPLDSKYGLGLTLSFDDNRVIVSTFVRHPDTDEMLPAEASGRMRPGDELVDINGHCVEGLNDVEATSLIRQARRESMEGGAVSLELTFREAVLEQGAEPVQSDRSTSPKPQTGWYPGRSKQSRPGMACSGRGSAKGSTAAGWASTDADRQALRWQPIGSDEIPLFDASILLPWLGSSAMVGEDAKAANGATPSSGGEGKSPIRNDSRWAEIGVYPPEDARRRREALLLGFRSAEASSSSGSNEEGYVVALLVEASPQGGVSVVEICRNSLEVGHQPVSFNREKVPPGAPTNGRATVEAVCMDGWVRRWYVAFTPASEDGGQGNLKTGQTSFALSSVNICQPFCSSDSGQGRTNKNAEDSKVAPPATLIAVASPVLLAVARSAGRLLSPLVSFQDHSKAAAIPESSAVDSQTTVEVWSCSKTPYPRCSFKKEETVALPVARAGQGVEGMCWVSPEAGDERGAAVSGHCLCVSVGGSVTVLAKERRQRLAGLVLAPEAAGGDWQWSPVFRVANPSSLLTCRTAGLRDFCQGLMAKYQRNLALSLVRSRRSKPSQAVASGFEAMSEASNHTPSPEPVPEPEPAAETPLPLLRDEISGLRGGITQEGRRLEDWHPESLVALWCTSLMAGREGEKEGTGGWAKGRERTLSVLRWVSKDVDSEAVGVMAGTVVPFLAHGSGEVSFGRDAADPGKDSLAKLKTCFSSYVDNRLADESTSEEESEKVGSAKCPPSSVRRLPHASTRHFIKGSTQRGITPASPRHIADTAASAGVPRRLLNLSGPELSALSALLDEALGDAINFAGAPSKPSTRSTTTAKDTAAALFSSARDPPPPPSPSSPSLGGFKSEAGKPTATLLIPVAAAENSDDCANVFFLARGLRARLARNGASTASDDGGENSIETGIATSTALGMLLAPSSTQKEVLETICPKVGGGIGGLTWQDARAMLLPLWVRDVAELQRITETVASNTFLKKKDIMEAALFFGVLGKEKKLLALAKTDRGFVGQRQISGQEGDINTNSGQAAGPTQGQRLEKLLAHDFASRRGRSVVEKNGFVLMRKRKFKAAAAVFLLARPAMLKEALQVILMHVKDLQLAFLVSRLIEARDGAGSSPTTMLTSTGGLGSGGGFGLGGLGGGGFGGGFGSVGRGGRDNEDKVNVAAVHESIGGASRKLLRDEFLPTFDGECDVPKAWKRHGTIARSRSYSAIGSAHAAPSKRNPFIECATLFWLGQSERALRALCRGPAAEHNAYNPAISASTTSPGKGAPTSTVMMDGAAGLGLCNRAIDVATRPFLVSKLIEILNIGSGKRNSPKVRVSWGVSATGWKASNSVPLGGANTDNNGVAGDVNVPELAQRAASVRLTTVEYFARNGMEISALEVLGSGAGGKWAAKLAKQQLEEESRKPVAGPPAVESGKVESDPGDVSGSLISGSTVSKPRQPTKPNMSSTEPDGPIFTGFGGLFKQPTPKASAAVTGELSGDMFGGFNGAPQRSVKPTAAASNVAAASGEISGDMFGGFDGPPRTQPTPPAMPASAAASGELTGDMFGGFDGPPQRKPQPTVTSSAAAAASGELSGDMFGGFDGPPRTQPTPPAVPASAAASGELTGDMFGGLDGPPQRKPQPTVASSAAAAASGELSGDMLGGFDGPPRTQPIPPAVPASAAASGELTGDKFGGLDGPPQRKPQPTVASSAAAAASGELSGDMFGGFDGRKKAGLASPVKTAALTSGNLEKASLKTPGGTRGRAALSSNSGFKSVESGELSGDLFDAFDGPPAKLGVSQLRTDLGSPAPSTIWTPGSTRPSLGSPRSSFGASHSFRRSMSIGGYGYQDGDGPKWEAYDRFTQRQYADDEATGSAASGKDLIDDGFDFEDEDEGLRAPSQVPNSDIDVPERWALWAEDLAYEAATRRLLRELRHLFGGLDALAPTAPNMAFALESLGAGNEPLALLEDVRATANALCEEHGLSPRALTAAAAGALSHTSAGGSRRLGALCLLLHLLDRPVAVDAAVCAAAGRLLQCCSAHGQAHLEDLSLRAAHARALGTEAKAAKKEAKAKALSEAEESDAEARPTSPRPEGSFITAAVAAANAKKKATAARAAEVAAAEAAGGLGLENLRPHLSELRAAAFQLELCLTLHARGCLQLSSRARAEAAVGFRAGLLVEALGRRYDVTAALVGCPPSKEPVNPPPEGGTRGDAEDVRGFPGDPRDDIPSVSTGGAERKAWLNTTNGDLLDTLSRLPRPEFEALGLEPWESSLKGRPILPPKKKNLSDIPPVIPSSPTEETMRGVTPTTGGKSAGGKRGVAFLPTHGTEEERSHLVRLTESLSRGVWPTYARLACALNLLTLRAIHTQLCRSLARLIWRPDYHARAPLAARVCGAVPFHPAGQSGQALGTLVKGNPDRGRVGREKYLGGGSSASSTTFYSAFLHPLYVWAQCLDRQFYAQAHRPRVSPAHHLVPRLHEKILNAVARPTFGAAPSSGGASAGVAQDSRGAPLGKYESSLKSPGAERRECCPYLFQRGMLVSEEGVRGGLDHLRSDEAWPEEDGEEKIAHQTLNGIRLADGSALSSVPLHAIREGTGADAHFVEAFYSSDARSWLLRAGVDPAGPSAGARLRRWESLGIVRRVTKAPGTGGQINFRGERHKGDTLLRFVDRWEVEHCGESGGGALRAGPLGRVFYEPVPYGKAAADRETLYGKLLHAIGEKAASELWGKLGAEVWLVRTVSRAEFPFSYRHQMSDFYPARAPTEEEGPPGVSTLACAAPLTPAAAAAAAAELPCPLHDGKRAERNAFSLCVFEYLCRNALFRRLRLPHRFQALVNVQLLGLKNLSPHYHPTKTDVFAAVSLKRSEPIVSGYHIGGSKANGHPVQEHSSSSHSGGDTAAKRRGRNTSVSAITRLLPTANGQASEQSRWGTKFAFRFPLPEEASPYVLAYGDGAYELVMGGLGGDTGGGVGMGSQGPPRFVRIAVWRKQFLADQRLGLVEVPLSRLNDRVHIDEWVGLRGGDKGSSWFVNVKFSLRFVMVSVSDPIVDDDSDDEEGSAPDSPGLTSLSYAMADVDIM